MFSRQFSAMKYRCPDMKVSHIVVNYTRSGSRRGDLHLCTSLSSNPTLSGQRIQLFNILFLLCQGTGDTVDVTVLRDNVKSWGKVKGRSFIFSFLWSHWRLVVWLMIAAIYALASTFGQEWNNYEGNYWIESCSADMYSFSEVRIIIWVILWIVRCQW